MKGERVMRSGGVRVRWWGATLALGLVATLASCSSDASPETSTVSPAAADVFPVSLEHKYGTTTVSSQPARVVTVGVTEQDTVLALGIAPVGVTEWYGEYDYAAWPWAQEALGDAKPEVLSTSDGLDFEAIAGLAPDLIIGTNAGLTRSDYEALTKIAPTVAQSGDYSDYFEPWDVQALAAGTALGLEAEVTELIDQVEADFAAAAEAHPEFAGTKAIFLQNAFYDGNAIAYQNGLSTDFLTDLGFEVPADIDEFSQGGEQAYIPIENLSVLNSADVLLWATEAPGDRAALEEETLYRRLEPVQSGRLAFTDSTLAGAIYFSSLLSLPYVLDELVPRLKTAVEGDPSLAPQG